MTSSKKASTRPAENAGSGPPGSAGKSGDDGDLIGQISRGLAHDLQSLLTPISLFLEFSQEDPPASGKAAALLPLAVRNVKAMRALIRQTLYFSQRQEPTFRPERIDLLARQAVDLAGTDLQTAKVRVEINAPQPLSAEADEVMILRLLGNLLSNAIKASPPGAKIRLGLRRIPPTARTAERVRIRIADQGPGIPDDILAWLSDPRQQTQPVSPGGGHGLGLPICRRIVQLHKGALAFKKTGKGTIVEIDLPVKR